MLGEMGADFSGIERAGETLTPTMDLWALPEWALLRGETIFSRIWSVGAQAALFSSAEFVNPAGSGVLAVVLELGNVSGNTLQASIDSGTAIGVVGTVRGVANDSRFPQLGEVSRCSITTGNLAAGAALAQDHIPNNSRSVRAYIIRPGNKLFISTGAVNLDCVGNLYWTERSLLPNEQNA